MSHFANYHKQRESFNNLFSKDFSNKILLIEGKSGSGKTALLTACLASKKINCVGIELRSTSVSVTEIFSRSATHVGWEKLKTFSDCAKSLAATAPKVELTGVQQQGTTNNISIALNVENVNERERSQTLLTDAWFNDINNTNSPLVLVFDTYEKAPTEIKNWLSGPFLSRAAASNTVRVAIAGQTVPAANIEWGNSHIRHELYGVPEALEWLPVVKALGKIIPVEPAEAWLAGICHALKGQPSEIMKILESLPNSNIYQ